MPAPDYNRLTELSFGEYVQTTQETGNTNSARTIGAVALYPAETNRKSWYFMSLVSGQRIHRFNWRILPITTDAVNRIHEIAREEKRPLIESKIEQTAQEGVVDVVSSVQELAMDVGSFGTTKEGSMVSEDENGKESTEDFQESGKELMLPDVETFRLAENTVDNVN